MARADWCAIDLDGMLRRHMEDSQGNLRRAIPQSSLPSRPPYPDSTPLSTIKYCGSIVPSGT